MKDDHPDTMAVQWGRRLETAYREHRESIVNILCGKYPMPSIEDAMHEIFAQFLSRMPTSAAAREVTLEPAYLFACVRRRLIRTLAIDQQHRESTWNACRQGAIESSQSTAPKSDPVHGRDHSSDEVELANALGRLPSKLQEVMRLICAENVRRHDGARSLDCDENCFGVRRHRALVALREILIPDDSRVDRSQSRNDASNSQARRRRITDTAKETST